MKQKIKLSDWAKANGKEYKESWDMVKNGTFPEKITRNSKGSIFVLQESKASQDNKKPEFVAPVFASEEEKKTAVASTRRNRAATTSRTDEYYWIQNGVDPINGSGRTSKGNDCMDASESIRLVRLAYTNFSDLRNIINAMVEFSTSPIYWSGGTKKSRDFFEALFNKLGINNLQDKFFLEFFRSCNVFLYRFESAVKPDDIKKLSKAFGTEAAEKVKLPAKYVILNPENITAGGTITFFESQFYQRLNAYEVERLIKPVTDSDKEFLKSLPQEARDLISKKTGSTTIDIPLDSKYCYFIFYKKADYESMAVPFAWPVLKDLNWKAEMKQIDMAVARTTQRAVLLITMGYENKNGEYVLDARAITNMQALFENESVGKTLVADFTTKGEWLVPEVDKILGPAKYQQVNEDIRNGLNNILSGGGDEKFANQSIKVKLFIQRLKQSREAFLNEFLIPEVKRISKDLGFRSYPTPSFSDIDLKDEDLWNRIIAQLAGIGYLTAEETFEAMQSGRLPTQEESIESQREFKKLKDEGLYQTPQVNPSGQLEVLNETNKHAVKMQDKQFEQDSKEKTKDRKHAAENPVAPAPSIHIQAPTKMAQPKGSPKGTKKPNTKKKVKPISAALIYENSVLAIAAEEELNKQLLKKFKLKQLNEQQESVKKMLLTNIMASELSSQWTNEEVIASYVKNPEKINEEKYSKIRELAQEHSVNDYLASIIEASQGKEEVEIEEEDNA